MKKNEVIELLKTNQNERGIQYWEKLNPQPDSLKSYGIGLTALRKLAKQIGRDHTLSKDLWKSDFYDAKIIALLIDDPKYITKEQAEQQVEEMKQGHLAHVYSSCNATLAKTPFVVELLTDWIDSKDTIRKRCGYGLLYEVSKSKKKNAPSDDFYLQRIDHIHKTFKNEKNIIQLSMAGALLGIGKRNLKLNAAALKVAKIMGPIPVETGVTKCEPFDVSKHLTSAYVRNKLGL